MMQYLKQTYNAIPCGLIVTLLMLFASILQAQGGGTEDQEVVAKGMGAIIADDEAKAADDALNSALRTAVEQVVGTMIEANTLVMNYQVMEDRIYSKTSGYVRSYRVLNSRKQSSTIWETTVSAIVSKGNLENDLQAIGVLMARKNKPRMMILVDEVNMGQHYHAYLVDMNTTENAILNKLMEKGYRFVDKGVAANKLKRDAVTAAINGDVNAAQSIANETGAEVLIIGKAVSKQATSVPPALRQAGMTSSQATLTLKAVRADDGAIIATSSQSAPAAHIDNLIGGTNALTKASEMAAEELNRKILDVWSKDVSSGTMIQVRLMDVPSFNDLVKFKNMMKLYLRGVQDVYQRDFSANTAILDLDVKGSANQVAEELILKDFSPYKVEVINTTQNAIVARLLVKEDG